MTDSTPPGPAFNHPRGMNQGTDKQKHSHNAFSNGPHGRIPQGQTPLPGKSSGYGFGGLEDDSGFISSNLENITRDQCFRISFKRRTGDHKNVVIIYTYKYNNENHQVFEDTFQRIDDVHTIMLDTSHVNRWKVNFLAQDQSVPIVNYAAEEISNLHKQEFANWILSTGLTLCRDEVSVHYTFKKNKLSKKTKQDI